MKKLGIEVKLWLIVALMVTLVILAGKVFGQIDITKRTVTLDSIQSRGSSIKIGTGNKALFISQNPTTQLTLGFKNYNFNNANFKNAHHELLVGDTVSGSGIAGYVATISNPVSIGASCGGIGFFDYSYGNLSKRAWQLRASLEQTNPRRFGFQIQQGVGTPSVDTITTKFYIDGTTGYIGLGDNNENPNYNLDVRSKTAISALQLTNTTTGNAATDGIVLFNQNNIAYLVNRENDNFHLRTNNADILILKPDSVISEKTFKLKNLPQSGTFDLVLKNGVVDTTIIKTDLTVTSTQINDGDSILISSDCSDISQLLFKLGTGTDYAGSGTDSTQVYVYYRGVKTMAFYIPDDWITNVATAGVGQRKFFDTPYDLGSPVWIDFAPQYTTGTRTMTITTKK